MATPLKTWRKGRTQPSLKTHQKGERSMSIETGNNVSSRRGRISHRSHRQNPTKYARSSTDVAMDTAPITLMRPSLDLILQTFILSQKTFRVIQENLFWALLLNGIGIGLAVFGQLGPKLRVQRWQ